MPLSFSNNVFHRVCNTTQGFGRICEIFVFYTKATEKLINLFVRPADIIFSAARRQFILGIGSGAMDAAEPHSQ